jgi:hypothetical protein
MAIRTAVNRALTAITALPTAAALVNGNLTLLTTATASSSATLDFTSSIDSTYDSYVFKFIDIHPQTDSVSFQFNMSIDGGSNYNVTKTTTFFQALHEESGSSSELIYNTGKDLAQSTSFANISNSTGNNSDDNTGGQLTLFNPSSTTFVKHFITDVNSSYRTGLPSSGRFLGAGYGNTTSAVDAIQFKIDSGNIDSGIIKMYGVGDKQS